MHCNHSTFQKLFLVSAAIMVLAWSINASQAAGKLKFYTLYLTGDRVCEQCTWRWVKVNRADRMELINKAGDSAIVHPDEILGVDNHPFWRKLMLKSLAGIGNAGPAIVPHAFENSTDLTCKYCDKFEDEASRHP